MIYMLVTNGIVPGKMNEYREIVSKELRPIQEKLGIRLVASWRTTVGDANEIVALFAYDDLTHLQRTREAARQSNEYVRVSEKLLAILTSQNSKILEPNPWSPMK